MSSIDINIVSTPNLEKIENFINDSTYRETIEYSANFNTRLCTERRLRLPFLDPQTGVAQVIFFFLILFQKLQLQFFF